MGLKEDLQVEVISIFGTQFETREGRVVPEPENVKLGNDAVTFEEAVVLYADLAESTRLVDKFYDWFAADVYKSYLHCASKIIKEQGGTITAFDGDRVMAVFLGDRKCTNAAICGLKITYAVSDIINAEINRRWSNSGYLLSQTVGIDISKQFVVRTGVRGSNDLVWIGRSANYAAKLCALGSNTTSTTIITSDVYDRLQNEAKYGGKYNEHMWTRKPWPDKNIDIYSSNWYWSV